MANTFASKAVMLCFLASVAGCAGSPTKESTGEMIDDTTITTRVKSAFVADKEVASHNVTVETFKGTVQLSGFVGSAAERDKAGNIAASTRGVKSVRNDLVVK